MKDVSDSKPHRPRGPWNIRDADSCRFVQSDEVEAAEKRHDFHIERGVGALQAVDEAEDGGTT